MKISLADFAEVGGRGTPAGMIGSADRCAVAGEIGADETEDPGPLRSGRRFAWVWAALALGLLVLGAGVWSGLRGAQPVSELAFEGRVEVPTQAPTMLEVEAGETGGAARRDAGASEPTPVEPTSDDEDEAEIDEDAAPRRPGERPSHRSRECEELRSRADAARRAGEWERLEQLARESRCWPRRSSAIVLRIRALFELDRYRECIELGSESKSKEVRRWMETCERAL